MAITEAVDQTVIEADLWNELARLVNGTAGGGEPVKLYDFSSTSVYSLTVGNQDTTNGLIASFQYGTVGNATTVAQIRKEGIIAKLRDLGGWTFNLEANLTAGTVINTGSETAANLAALDAAWTAAFAAVSAAGGGTISVGPGTFRYWSSTVTPADNCIIRGAGEGATKLEHRTDDFTGVSFLNFTGKSGVWLIDLTVDGNYTGNHGTSTGFSGAEVVFQGGSECGMLRCTIQAFNYFGVIPAGTRTSLIDVRVIGENASSYPTANLYDSQTIINFDLRSVYGVLCPGTALSTGLFIMGLYVSGTRSAGVYVGGTNCLAVDVWASGCHKGYWPDDGGGTPAGIGNRQGGGQIATTFTWDGVAALPGGASNTTATGFVFLHPKSTGATGPATSAMEIGSAANVEILNPYLVSGASGTGVGLIMYHGPTRVVGGIIANVVNTGAGSQAGIEIADGASGITVEGTLLQFNEYGINISTGGGTAPNHVVLHGLRFNVNATANLLLGVTPADFTSYGHMAIDGSTVPPNIWPKTTYIGDTANVGSTLGLTINQGAADDQILTLKSSDVAHGMTTIVGTAEDDTFGYFVKAGAADGGLTVVGLTEVTKAIVLSGLATTDNTTQSAAGLAHIMAIAATKSGTSITAAGATANIFGVSNNGNTELLVTGNGNIYYDGTTNAAAWDDHDDAALLSSFRVLTAPGISYATRFESALQEHAEILQRTGIINQDEHGRIMVSHKDLTGLMIDAVRQLGARIETLEALALPPGRP